MNQSQIRRNATAELLLHLYYRQNDYKKFNEKRP